MTTSNEGPYRTQPPVPPPPPPTRVYAVLATLAVIWGLVGAIAMISTSHHSAYDGRSDEWVKYAIAAFPSGLAGLFILLRLLSFPPNVRPSGVVMAAVAMCLTAFAWAGTVVLHTDAPYHSAHGRRHRKSKGGKNLLAGNEESDAWALASFELDVPEETRFALAAEWRENARKEHASIAAFSQLALDLMAVGAPPHLLAAAHRDAADEVRHAELCYGVARSIDGVALSPAPFPEARAQKAAAKTRSEALTQVAIDSLMDGVLSEGTAARILARVSKTCRFPELADSLRAIAADESRHAQDSWDVIAWCLEVGGSDVAVRLDEARRKMPKVLSSSLPEDAKRGGWEHWGIQGAQLENDAFTKTRAQADQRLSEMLRAHLPTRATTFRAA